MAKKRLRTSKLLIGVILLGMITMRLAWIENRAYPSYLGDHPWFDLRADATQLPLSTYCGYVPALPDGYGVSPFASLQAMGYICHYHRLFGPAGQDQGGPPEESDLRQVVVDTNMALMILTALMAGFSARLIGRSWLLASAIGAMLLSRGRWLSGLGQVNDYYLWGLVLAVWLLLACYFFKTASRYPYGLLWLGLTAAGLALPEAHLLFVAFALVWLVVYLAPDRGQLGPPSPIRLLGAVNLPIGQAAAIHRKKLMPLAVLGGVGLILSLVLIKPHFQPVHVVHWWDLRVLAGWFQELKQPIDIDLSIAMSMMLIALVLPYHRRYPLLKVAISLVFTALAITIVASAWWALPKESLWLRPVFNIFLKPGYILAVFEPLLLVLGGLSLWMVAGQLYDFLKTVSRSSTVMRIFSDKKPIAK